MVFQFTLRLSPARTVARFLARSCIPASIDLFGRVRNGRVALKSTPIATTIDIKYRYVGSETTKEISDQEVTLRKDNDFIDSTERREGQIRADSLPMYGPNPIVNGGTVKLIQIAQSEKSCHRSRHPANTIHKVRFIMEVIRD
jgi:hypothetical protein